MLDFCVGLDTEFSEIVEGSHLYFPKTQFAQVRQSVERTLYNYFYVHKINSTSFVILFSE